MSKDVSRGFAMESSESLDAATQLCLRCDTFKFIESETMWHRLLDWRHFGSNNIRFLGSICRPNAPRTCRTHPSRYARTCRAGKSSWRRLKMRGNETLRELRRVLTGILETVEREKDGDESRKKIRTQGDQSDGREAFARSRKVEGLTKLSSSSRNLLCNHLRRLYRSDINSRGGSLLTATTPRTLSSLNATRRKIKQDLRSNNNKNRQGANRFKLL